MQLKTGRRLRLTACIAGIIGGLGQAMLAFGIYERTQTNIDATMAAGMAISNFVVSLVLLGHHGIHIYPPIKSSIGCLFIGGILINLVGVAGLLLNENASFGGDMTDHLLFDSRYPQDYAFTALFYISVCLSCVFAAGLATYFLINVPSGLCCEAASEMSTSASMKRSDPEAQNDAVHTVLAMGAPVKCSDPKQTVNFTNRIPETLSTSSSSSDVSQVDGNSFCSAQSEGISIGGSSESTLTDKRQSEPVTAVEDRISSQAQPLPAAHHIESAETQALSPSFTRYHTIENQDLASSKSTTRCRRSNKDHLSRTKAETSLGQPLCTSTPFRARSSSGELSVPATPPPPLPPSTTPYKHYTSKSDARSTRHYFRDIPEHWNIAPIQKFKKTRTDISASTTFRGLPNALLNEVLSFDTRKLTKSKRRMSCTNSSETQFPEGSSSCGAKVASSSGATMDHSTQTSLTDKQQYQNKPL